MKQRFLFSIALAGLMYGAKAQVQWPAVTQTAKPWTRWWWEGSAVNKKDLTWNLEQYKNAGLGGVEITPIYGVHGYESQFISFLSPQWMQVFDHTLSEAKRLRLGVDLANATGWPFGGPWVTDEDASKTMYLKTYSLSSGETLKEPVVYHQDGLVIAANRKPVSFDTLKQPVTANKDLQSLALDQIIYPGDQPLQLLMAYSDKGTSVDITRYVNKIGALNWKAPEGKWTLYALFTGLHGKMVERAAPGGEGYAIDHFSSDAVKHYFKKFDDAFKGHDISYLRAFFNDSYEVDDARGQADWTPTLFEEFKKRRGYDLKEHLPALMAKDISEQSSRILFDYRQTIDELLLEHFTESWQKWGTSKGAMVRNQSHGSPANILDLYSAVDIPETEGTDLLRFKFATSAAHVTGKKLASSESATWLNDHFLSSWGDVKKAIDLYFLGGVNHIFYHGTEYSPKDAPWPGWLFYAAVHFQPVNPQWNDLGTLNQYIARCQSFLQQGKPDNDVLLYFPIEDRYSIPGKTLLQHYDGMERNFEGTDFEHLAQKMLESQIGFDFFSARQLQKFTTQNNKIITGGSSYGAILLPGNKYLTAASLQQLIQLAKNGATVLIYKNMPESVPGYGQFAEHSTLFQQLNAQLQFIENGGIKKATIGKGAFYLSDDVEALMKAGDIRRETTGEQGLSCIRRMSNDGHTYFIDNRRDEAFEGWVTLSAKAESVAAFNAMTGSKGLAMWRKNNSGQAEVYIQLQPYESVILEVSNKKLNGEKYAYWKPAGKAQELTGTWNLQYINGGPVLPSEKKLTDLSSWTSLGEDEKNFSGTALYMLEFKNPGIKTGSLLLDLGTVHETASVSLNGKKLSTLIGPSYQVIIPSSALSANNKLEVKVSNLMANRIAYMDRNNLPWKIFYNTNMPAKKKENSKVGLFNAADWKPVPSGLVGPVTLTPLSMIINDNSIANQ